MTMNEQQRLYEIVIIIWSKGYIDNRDVQSLIKSNKSIYLDCIKNNTLYQTISKLYLLKYITLLCRLKLIPSIYINSSNNNNNNNNHQHIKARSLLPLPFINHYSIIQFIQQQQQQTPFIETPKIARQLGELSEILDGCCINDSGVNDGYWLPQSHHDLLNYLTHNELYTSILQSSIVTGTSGNGKRHSSREIYHQLSFIDRLQSYLILKQQSSQQQQQSTMTTTISSLSSPSLNYLNILSFILKIMHSFQSLNLFKSTTPTTSTSTSLRSSSNQSLSHIQNQLPTLDSSILLLQLLQINPCSNIGDISPIPLMTAVARGNAIALKLLLSIPNMYNIHVKVGGSQRNALFYATNREVTLSLLQQRVRTDQPDVYGMLPIHLKASTGAIDVIKCLLDDSTINTQDLAQNTPLHWASLRGHLAVVKLLMSSGARNNIPNAQGRYPIHNAALEGHQEMVKFYIDHYSKVSSSLRGSMKGTSIQIPDKEYNTPIDLSVLHNHFACAFEMLRYEGFIVPSSDIDLSRSNRIGSGAFADVYQIQWRDRLVAVKRVKYQKLVESGKSDHWIVSKFILEVALMVKLSHLQSFVKLYGTVIEQNELMLILEYCTYGSLYNILNSIGNDQIISSLPSINILSQSLANGMAYLHGLSPQIIHRDLTSQNILLDSSGSAKVADFGISRFKNEIGDKTMTSIGNPRWRAPEVTKGQKYSEKVDVFGFGMILYEMFTRRYPFHEFEAIQASFKIAGGERPVIPPYVDSRWAKLIQRCWDQTPSNRPSFLEVTTILQQLPIANIKLFSDPAMSFFSSTVPTTIATNTTDFPMSDTQDGSYEID